MHRYDRFSDMVATEINSLGSNHGEFPKLVSSDSYSIYNGPNQNHIQNDHRQWSESESEPHSYSLTRYQSAPSSFYTNLLDESDFLDLHVDTSSNNEFFSPHQQQQQQQQQMIQSDSCEFRPNESLSRSMKHEPKESGIQKIDFLAKPHLRPSNINGICSHNNLESASRSRSMNSPSLNLIRQSSSPAGFLSTLHSERGMRDVDKSIISSSRLNNNINFSPGLSSSSSMCLKTGIKYRNQINDSPFKSLKRTRDAGDSITLNTQDRSLGLDSPGLVYHLSLPNTSSDMSTAENLLRFEQDLVPSKSRAKRGCATHPRSIAERDRRTRISNRMKKLQQLFPNMDKQTSIADMLDIAVQYIKDLQKDLQTLKDARSRCTCSIK